METEKTSIRSLVQDSAIVGAGIPAYTVVHGIIAGSKAANGSYFSPSKKVIGEALSTGFSSGAILGSALAAVAFFGIRYVSTFQEKVERSRINDGRAR